MEVLWAGWRSAYMDVVATGTDDEACLFCALPEGEDRETYILERGEHAYSLLNLYPYTNGHLMITPYRHVGAPGELSEAELLEVWRLLSRSQSALGRTVSPHGYNLGVNQGRAGGTGVLGHFHMHVVPRWNGDANFMTATANARILPVPLEETWRGLREALEGV